MRSDPYRSDPELLTVADVTETLRISTKAAYSLIHSGELKSFRRGRHFCVRHKDLETYKTQLENRNATDKFDINLPQSIIDSLARHLAAEIRKYYDSEEGQLVFAEWLKDHEEI